MNVVCTICSELIKPFETLHFTKCGHLFHFQCLHTWITQSKTCPQCRNRVTPESLCRFYPTTRDIIGEDNAVTLQMKLDHAELMINQQEIKLKSYEMKVSQADSQQEILRTKVNTLRGQVEIQQLQLASNNERISSLKKEIDNLCNVKQELELCKQKILTFEGLQKVLDDTVDEVENMLEGYPDVRTVATFATALKKALYESESEKAALRKKYNSLKKDLREAKFKYCLVKDQNDQLLDNVSEVKKKYENLKKTIHQSLDQIDEDLEPVSSASPRIFDNTIKMSSESGPNRLTSMINQIESSVSPYLDVKQGVVEYCKILNSPLASISKGLGKKKIPSPKRTTLCNSKKESIDFLSILNGDGVHVDKDKPKSKGNMTYDGLGGYAPVSDTIPKPKANLPKLTAKHRLKRPNPDGTPTLLGDVKKRFLFGANES